MRRLIVLAGMTLALAAAAEAATLNKCIDVKGKVTYSNLPCQNAREAREVNIDPAPQPDPAREQPARVQAAPPPSLPKRATTAEPPTIRLETRQTSGAPTARSSARQCDALTDKLGRVFDKMDQAHHKGYTQKQMDAWNQEVKDLEHKKRESGCF